MKTFGLAMLATLALATYAIARMTRPIGLAALSLVTLALRRLIDFTFWTLRIATICGIIYTAWRLIATH